MYLIALIALLPQSSRFCIGIAIAIGYRSLFQSSKFDARHPMPVAIAIPIPRIHGKEQAEMHRLSS